MSRQTPREHVLVADAGNDNIRIFDSGGVNISNIDTTGPTTGSTLRAVATNSTGHVFAVYNNVDDIGVPIYTASGVYTGNLPFEGDVSLGTISDLIVRPDDKIIVSDSLNNGVHVFANQPLFSDTGTERFEFAISTTGNFGIPPVAVTITATGVVSGATEDTMLNFVVTFGRDVMGFDPESDSGDVVISGTATATASNFSGSGSLLQL